jgi:hypothetical protein
MPKQQAKFLSHDPFILSFSLYMVFLLASQRDASRLAEKGKDEEVAGKQPRTYI